MTRRRLLVPALVAGLAVLVLTGCGNDTEPPPHHGLRTEAVTSKPVGDPIEVGFDVGDGTSYVAEVRFTTDFWQRTAQGGAPSEKRADASATMELVQTFHTPSADRTPTSDISLRYIAAKGHGADTFLARPTITGRMDHTQTGRAVTSTLVLDGGTPTEQIEARDRLGGLTLAGFGGSPMWLPEGPVRVGQAWPVERFLDPRGVANARRQAQQTGLKAPEPTFSGTVRVVKATDGPEGKLLEVAIDALIEVAGPFEKGPERGHMSYANQVRGTAIIDARTGLPTSFECTEEVRTDVRQGAAQVQQRATATVRATVQRKD